MTRLVRFLTPTGAFRAWWAVALTIVALLVAVFASIGYTARSVRHSDQQWCDLLRGIDQPLPSNSPTTERQRQFVNTVHRLRVDKGC